MQLKSDPRDYCARQAELLGLRQEGREKAIAQARGQITPARSDTEIIRAARKLIADLGG